MADNELDELRLENVAQQALDENELDVEVSNRTTTEISGRYNELQVRIDTLTRLLTRQEKSQAMDREFQGIINEYSALKRKHRVCLRHLTAADQGELYTIAESAQTNVKKLEEDYSRITQEAEDRRVQTRKEQEESDHQIKVENSLASITFLNETAIMIYDKHPYFTKPEFTTNGVDKSLKVEEIEAAIELLSETKRAINEVFLELQNVKYNGFLDKHKEHISSLIRKIDITVHNMKQYKISVSPKTGQNGDGDLDKKIIDLTSQVGDLSVKGKNGEKNLSTVFRRIALPTYDGKSKRDFIPFQQTFKALIANQYKDPIALAHILKESCTDYAAEVIANIQPTSPDSYDKLWNELRMNFSDRRIVTHDAKQILSNCPKLNSRDYKKQLSFIRSVEEAYNLLEQAASLNAVPVEVVDDLCEKLPDSMAREFQKEIYDELGEEEKLFPFPAFVKFLIGQKAYIIRLADRSGQQPSKSCNRITKSAPGDSQGKSGYKKGGINPPRAIKQSFNLQKQQGPPYKTYNKKPYNKEPQEKYGNKGGKFNGTKNFSQTSSNNQNSNKACAIHGKGHTTYRCNVFKRMDPKNRALAVKNAGACYNCLCKVEDITAHIKSCKIFELFPKTACNCGQGKPHNFMTCTKTKNNKKYSKSVNMSKKGKPQKDSKNTTKSVNMVQKLVDREPWEDGYDSDKSDYMPPMSRECHRIEKRIIPKNQYKNWKAQNPKKAYNTKNRERFCKKQNNSKAIIKKLENQVALYPVHAGIVTNGEGKEAKINIFYDGGSDCSLLTDSLAEELGLECFGESRISIESIGGSTTTSKLYKIFLKTKTGKLIPHYVYSVKHITNKVHYYKKEIMEKYFPGEDIESTLRLNAPVQILIGSDLPSVYPIPKTSYKQNLVYLEGELGNAIQGTCDELLITNKKYACVHYIKANYDPLENDKISEKDHYKKASDCADCIICNQCKIMTSDLSFSKQVELNMIQKLLRFDEKQKHFVTACPWKTPLAQLDIPNNREAVYRSLIALERKLKKNPEHWDLYIKKFDDLQDRNFIRKITDAELKNWKGKYMYLSQMAIMSPDSNSTPLRIVFDSKRKYGSTSRNDLLFSGPSPFDKKVSEILIMWMEGRDAFIADIASFFHAVRYEIQESHMCRFLFRRDPSKPPEEYFFLRMLQGDVNSPCTAVESLRRATAAMRDKGYEHVHAAVHAGSWMDDISYSTDNREDLLKMMKDMIFVLGEADFRFKGIVVSGENFQRDSKGEKSDNKVFKGDGDEITCLGLHYCPSRDTYRMKVTLNTSERKRNKYTQPQDVEFIPEKVLKMKLDRRAIVGIVNRLWDPLSHFLPYLLTGKLMLRNMLPTEGQIDWDKEISAEDRPKFIKYVENLFRLKDMTFKRCLVPPDYKGTGAKLVTFCDGSMEAVCCVTYAFFPLKNGTWKARLIAAKGKIAPKRGAFSIPEMELDAAVRGISLSREIEKTMRLKFDEILHITDSGTVFCQIQNGKTRRFETYTHLRLHKIWRDNRVETFRHTESSLNNADYGTKPLSIEEITNKNHPWWTGPKYLETLQPSEWPLKKSMTTPEGQIQGELKAKKQKKKSNQTDNKIPNYELDRKKSVNIATKCNKHIFYGEGYNKVIHLSRFRSAERVVCTLARVLMILRKKTFKGGTLNPDIIQECRIRLILETQKTLNIKETGFKTIRPIKTSSGVYVCGTRVKSQLEDTMSPMDAQILLPRKAAYTFLLAVDIHNKLHLGENKTLQAFSSLYFTPNARSLISKVTESCLKCRKSNKKTLQAVMGKLPLLRTCAAPAFSYVMIDAWGPIKVRHETLHRRTRSLTALAITDLTSRAAHIELLGGEDYESFLLGWRNYLSIRQWPRVIYSDCAATYKKASETIKAWSEADFYNFRELAARNCCEWRWGSPLSHHTQAPVERLIGLVRKSLTKALADTAQSTLSYFEMKAIISDVIGIINSTPMGSVRLKDAERVVCTPYMLLTGVSGIQQQPLLEHTSSVEGRIKFCQNVITKFYEIWEMTYFPSMIRQSKWKTGNKHTPEIGDICYTIATEDTMKSNHKWRLGRITEVHISKDGICREVAIQYKNTIERPDKSYAVTKPVTVIRSIHQVALMLKINKDTELDWFPQEDPPPGWIPGDEITEKPQQENEEGKNTEANKKDEGNQTITTPNITADHNNTNKNNRKKENKNNDQTQKTHSMKLRSGKGGKNNPQ